MNDKCFYINNKCIEKFSEDDIECGKGDPAWDNLWQAHLPSGKKCPENQFCFTDPKKSMGVYRHCIDKLDNGEKCLGRITGKELGEMLDEESEDGIPGLEIPYGDIACKSGFCLPTWSKRIKEGKHICAEKASVKNDRGYKVSCGGGENYYLNNDGICEKCDLDDDNTALNTDQNVCIRCKGQLKLNDWKNECICKVGEKNDEGNCECPKNSYYDEKINACLCKTVGSDIKNECKCDEYTTFSHDDKKNYCTNRVEPCIIKGQYSMLNEKGDTVCACPILTGKLGESNEKKYCKYKEFEDEESTCQISGQFENDDGNCECPIKSEDGENDTRVNSNTGAKYCTYLDIFNHNQYNKSKRGCDFQLNSEGKVIIKCNQ